jgi:hypothetical protein
MARHTVVVVQQVYLGRTREESKAHAVRDGLRDESVHRPLSV